MNKDRKLLAVWTPRRLQRNQIFDPNTELNRDNCLAPYIRLKKVFYRNGWDVETFDLVMKNGRIPDAVFFTNVPRLPAQLIVSRRWRKIPRLALCLECSTISPHYWYNYLQRGFDVVFTWSRSATRKSRPRYEWLNFSQDLSVSSRKVSFEQKKLCTLLATNFYLWSEGELYSARRSWVRWFERNAPGDFELYGSKWDVFFIVRPRILRVLSSRLLSRNIRPHFSSWRGFADSKLDTLDRYRFSICYENANSHLGYITEKIIDCFRAGCIPIYLGAPDIEQFIPEDCFIDVRKYDSKWEVYQFIKSMTADEHAAYIRRMDRFLQSDAGKCFGSDYFAKVVLDVTERVEYELSSKGQLS